MPHLTDAVVNGKEKGKKPPRLQKMVSIPAQDVIWQTMATEVDNEGYTPLLWACKVYRKYKVCNSFLDWIFLICG
ncbi:hypothetical protein DPMN_097158 [Dreissena polymorpha]|uniref:Uncharacterized protein n=1 Tax=Dreissena polymorpha TaxID=45954 RepID=A0A9D4LB83_DREPO|nr:hypothetical protein DPMN_097158 [Dreissena polymorpha]